MAWMNQEKKAAIAAALKQVVPTDWKYTLRVEHHSSIAMTITSAKTNLLGAIGKTQYFDPATATHADINVYHYGSHIVDPQVREVVGKIVEALNTGNWDKSDTQSDYFDVGHYVHLSIGRWDKPFAVKA